MNIPNVIDFEASGFGKGSYPIEVGFVTSTNLTWCSLIKPEADWQHWNQEAEVLHQITRDILFKHGRAASYVAEQLNSHLENTIVYTDAWLHDYTWMARLFDAAGIWPSFKLEDFRKILTPTQERHWDATKLLVLKDLNLTRHRASNDARVLQLTWMRTHYQSEMTAELSLAIP